MCKLFSRDTQRNKSFKIFYDQSYFLKKDYSKNLSDVLTLKVESSGIFFWKNIIKDIKKNVGKSNEIKIYFEGLFSPFQKKFFLI